MGLLVSSRDGFVHATSSSQSKINVGIASPAEFGNLVYWADAASVILDGASVSNMVDYVSGNDLQQLDANAAYKPTFLDASSSGLLTGAVRFDGVNDTLKTGSLVPVSSLPFTTCMLIRPRFVNSWRAATSARNTQGMRVGRHSSSSNWLLRNGLELDTNVSYTLNTWHFITVVWNGASTELFDGDVLKGTFNAGTSTDGGFTLGGKANGSGFISVDSYARVDIALFLAYNGSLSANRISSLLSGFVDKKFAYR